MEGEAVYLLNKPYSTAIMCIPDTTEYRATHKGGMEYDIDSNSDLVCDVFEYFTEIIQEEYEQY